MKIRVRLEDALLNIDLNDHSTFICKNGKDQILHLRMKKPLFGILKASILWYEKFNKDIKDTG